MLQQVADHPLLLVEAVKAGLTHIGIAREFTVRVGQLRADLREAGIRTAVAHPQIMRQQGQRGVAGRLQGQRRCNEKAVVGQAAGGQLRIARQARDAVKHLAVLIQRTRKIARYLAPVMVAHLHFQLAQRLFGGPLADHVDHAARAVLAIQHRGRATQHLDTLGAIDLGLPDRPAIVIAQLQAIQVVARGLRVEAADDRPVKARVGAPWRSIDPGRIGQAFLQARGAALFDEVRRHHRNGLRRFEDGAVRLGPRRAARGHIAVDRAPRRFGAARHRHRGQRGRAVGLRRPQGIGAAGAAQHPQALPLQQAGKTVQDRIVAAQARGCLAARQCRVHRQFHPGLAGVAGQCLVQRPRRNAVIAHGRAGPRRRRLNLGHGRCCRQQSGAQAQADAQRRAAQGGARDRALDRSGCGS